MKIVCIADTHNKHKQLNLDEFSDCDMIIHAGDVSSMGYEHEIDNFHKWYSNLNFKYKVFIAGNHDFYYCDALQSYIKEKMPDNIIYINEELKEVEGIKIWGSPITPVFCNWAFMRDRGIEIKRHWDLIPKGTDILITHGPPNKILDFAHGVFTGCEELAIRIKEIKPKYHIFGHIHEGYGIRKKPYGTTHINASVVNARYELVNKPIVIEI